MTTSGETHRDQNEPRVDEKDFAQHPEQESAQSSSIRVLLIIVLIAIGLLAIPILMVAYSSGVQGIFGEDMGEPEQIEQPAEQQQRQAPPESAPNAE